MKTHTGIYTAFVAVLSIFVSDIIDFGDGGTSRLAIRSQAAAVVSARADDGSLESRVESRQLDDVAAMQSFRPGYRFWQSVFTIPDGSIAFGSTLDGRHLATFPASGDWSSQARWTDASLARSLQGHLLPRLLDERREYVAEVLKAAVGPVTHNPTRGLFVAPGAQRYGRFLDEWGKIYERFGVPAEIGLAQALIESGFEGTRRSEANAVGLCQWLARNWKHLDKLDPAVIEVSNQTTQAAYCGAYLSVLATKYGSYIPALSEHHAGGTNVGRTIINGERLGGHDTRQQYFLGAQLARDLRTLAHPRFSDIYGSYGPRSFFYAEMVFGNAAHVREIADSSRQSKIYAMRTTRAIPLKEITRRTGLSVDEVRRYNPAIVKRVPARATLYLPKHVSAFGRDVTFWHRRAPANYAAVLNEFVRLDVSPEHWDNGSVDHTLRAFERRFRATNTAEGTIMATVLAYVGSELSTSGRRQILAEFRNSEQIRDLFEQAVREREASTN